MSDELSPDDEDKLDWPPFRGGFIPPYLGPEWLALRSRLSQAAAHAEAAAEASTLEDVESQTSLAYAELHRADYIRVGIEREKARRGRDQE